MEISPNRLRRLARDVDEQHRDAMGEMPEQLAEVHFGSTSQQVLAARRALLRRIGMGGAALAIGGVSVPLTGLLGVAQAQEDTTTTTAEGPDGQVESDGTGTLDVEEGATTSTTGLPAEDEPTPPEEPEPIGEDPVAGRSPELVALAVFAESVELAAVDVYEEALLSGLLSEPVAEVAALFQQHHLQHAQLFHGFVGPQQVTLANQTLLAAVTPQLEAARDEDALLELAYEVEEGAAATYQFALGVPMDAQLALNIAAILPVESQHAVVLGEVVGLPRSQWMPAFQTTDGAWDPEQFPVVSPDQAEELTAP